MRHSIYAEFVSHGFFNTIVYMHTLVLAAHYLAQKTSKEITTLLTGNLFQITNVLYLLPHPNSIIMSSMWSKSPINILSIHNDNTRNDNNFHRPNTNLLCFQKRTFLTGIKIFKFTT
jgi:hypothetical protein